MQVNRLLCVWLSGSEEESKVVRQKLDEKIGGYATGELGHAVATITSIWEISDKEGPLPSEPAPPAPLFSWFRSFFGAGSRGCDMGPSLIKSMQEGYLLDRKYWVRRSWEGDVEPIYFFSAVVRAELPGLDTRESPHPGGR